jgi:MFS family permease
MTNNAARIDQAPGRLGPLAFRDFRLLSIGQLTSTVGDYCYAVALPWLILSAHGGPVLLGAVLACYGIPRAVMIPVGGMLADRLGPRAVMLASDIVRCVLVVALAVLAGHGLGSLSLLGPTAALLGAGEGVFLPASAAIMPSLLPEEHLQSGNGLSAGAVQIGSLIGPVLGGLLVTTGGTTAAFAVDAGTFLASAASLALVREPLRAYVHDDEASSEAGAWRRLIGDRGLQVLILVVGLVSLVIAGTFQVALPDLAHSRFGAAGYGALLACFGAGSLAGTFAAARLSGLRRPTEATCVGLLIGAISVAFAPFLGGLPGAAAAVLVFGVAAMFGNVVMVTVLQRWAPGNLIGRAMSLVMLASMGTFPVAVALSGLIVGNVGPGPFFPAAGAVLVTAVALALSQRPFREFGAPIERVDDQPPVLESK